MFVYKFSIMVVELWEGSDLKNKNNALFIFGFSQEIV